MTTDAPVRPAATARDLRWDAALALGLFVAAVISAALSVTAGMFGNSSAGLGWAMLTSLCSTAPLALRRKYPITVATIVLTVFFLSVTYRIPEMFVINVSTFIAVYTIGAWVNNRRVAFWSRVVLITLMFVWLLVTMFITATDPNPDIDETFSRVGFFSPFVAYSLLQLGINAGFFGGAYYMGDRAFASAAERQDLARRQRELEHEREVTAAQAVALDRVAIARELHDVVAHHVSAMGVQAGAARAVMAINPDASAQALLGIESSARTAISELHQLLETLRTPGGEPLSADTSPSTLRLDRVPELVAHANDMGMDTQFSVVGVAAELPAVAHANLYRIAQEALTNARRHGGPDVHADVRIRYDADAVELEVANSGRDARLSRSGLGQLGMRERAAASGGTIDIGPRPRGGFLVRVRVPLSPGGNA